MGRHKDVKRFVEQLFADRRPEPDQAPAAERAAPEASAGRADDSATLALVDEALKKTGLVWVSLPSGRTQPCWHAWVDGRAYVLTGPGEQPDPGLDDSDELTLVVRSKDNSQRLLTLTATCERLDPADGDWDVATAALVSGRLNLSRAEQAPRRWAADPATVVYRLVPTGDLLEGPGAYADSSHRAVPVASSATTAGPPPRVLHRRGHSGRPLS